MGSDDILYYKEHFKLKRPGQAMFLVYRIENGLIRLDQKALEEAPKCGSELDPALCKQAHKEILEKYCPENDCCFIVFDFVAEGQDGSKIFYIMWNPDSASPKLKMLYASSKGAMKREMEGTIQLEAKESSDLSYNVLVDMANKSSKK